MDYSPPGSSLQEIPRQEHWSGLPFPSPGDLPDPRIKPQTPALTGKLFTTEPPGKPLQVWQNPIFFTGFDSFPFLQTRSVASSICDPTIFAQIKYYYRRAWFMAHGRCENKMCQINNSISSSVKVCALRTASLSPKTGPI